jgi:hypothetical protein
MKYLHETVGVSPWQQSYLLSALVEEIITRMSRICYCQFSLKIIVNIIIAMTTEFLATAINDRGHYSKLFMKTLVYMNHNVKVNYSTSNPPLILLFLKYFFENPFP